MPIARSFASHDAGAQLAGRVGLAGRSPADGDRQLRERLAVIGLGGDDDREAPLLLGAAGGEREDDEEPLHGVPAARASMRRTMNFAAWSLGSVARRRKYFSASLGRPLS